ncbi:unnamed protein product [Aphanomyces euteiches]
MTSWMRSGLQTVVDGSRRLKEELLQTAGVYEAGSVDPVVEARTQRFLQHSQAIDRLHAATVDYMKQIEAASKASTTLVHEFKLFFTTHLAQSHPDDNEEGKTLLRQLVHASECLENVHWAFKQTVHETTNTFLGDKVLKPLGRLKAQNATTQKHLHTRKQKMLDYDALRRSSASTRPETQQKIRVAEEAVVKMTAQVNQCFDDVEDSRGHLLRSELLAFTASQMFASTKCYLSLNQLVPIMPGVAGHLVDLSRRSKESHPLVHPTKNEILGIIDYSGPNSAMEYPVHQTKCLNLTLSQLDDMSRVDENAPFETMHALCKLIQDTYYAANSQDTMTTPSPLLQPDFDAGGLAT